MRLAPERLAACLLVLASAAGPARAQEAPPAVTALESAGEGQPARVESGHLLELADGRRLRLAGVLAPVAGSGQAATEAFAEQARAALAALVKETSLTVYLAAQDRDRHGRLRAHLVRGDGLWIQGALLNAGRLRVFTTPETGAAARALYAAEAEARRGERGLWGARRYAVQRAGKVRRPAGRFAVVRGRVREAAKVDGTVYLNFGADWRRDFTIRLRWPARRQLPQDRREAGWWGQRRIEVRGVLEDVNGPQITVTHPEQLRVERDATQGLALSDQQRPQPAGAEDATTSRGGDAGPRP